MTIPAWVAVLIAIIGIAAVLCLIPGTRYWLQAALFRLIG